MSENLLNLDSETPAETPNADWFIDEGIPGVGARPTWLNDKFKTVADLGKSYVELEKKFGTVPDEYDMSRSIYIDPDKDVIKDFLNVAREKRVPQEVIDKMVDSFDRYLGEVDVNPEEEAKKLGDNARERLRTLDNWAKANLSDGSYQALSKNLQSADSIKALEELRGKMMTSSTTIPGSNDSAANEVNTVETIQAEIVNNLEKYKTDPKFRAEIQGRLEVAVKRSGMVDKVGY